MSGLRAFAFLLTLAAPALAEAPWSPLYVEERLVIAFEGRANIAEGRVALRYELSNLSPDVFSLILLDDNATRREFVFDPGATQTFILERRMPRAEPERPNGAFHVRTYLNVIIDNNEPQVLVPAEVSSFIFTTELPEGARILASSIPIDYVQGTVLEDQKLRALPTIDVVYTLAAERIVIELVEAEDGTSVILIANQGGQIASGLVLTTMIETGAHPGASSPPWRVVQDDGVMQQWQAPLPDLAGGERLNLVLPVQYADAERRLHSITVHNGAGDLVAMQ
jgi:hypothetical protein